MQKLKELCYTVLTNPSKSAELYSTIFQTFDETFLSAHSETVELPLEILNFLERLYPHSPDVPFLIALILYRNHQYREAWQYLTKILTTGSQVGGPVSSPTTEEVKTRCDPQYRTLHSSVVNALVDRWHFPMLNDSKRNNCFRNAIRRAVVEKESNNLLDIGCGTGILSCYALQTNASRVLSVDSSALMCELAESALIELGRGRLDVFCTDSRHIKSTKQRVDVIVTETLDAGVLGEGILDTLQDILCKTNSPNHKATVLPRRVEAFVALVESDDIAKKYKLMSPDNWPFKEVPQVALVEPYSTERMEELDGGYKLLSDWQAVYNVNLNSLEDIQNSLSGNKNDSLSLKCVQDGRIDAVILSFKLHVDEQNSLGTFPGENSCWECAVYPVYTVMAATEEFVDVEIVADSALRVSLLDDVKSKERICVDVLSMNAINSKEYVDAFTNAAEKIAHEVSTSKIFVSKLRVYDNTPYAIGTYILNKLLPNVLATISNEAMANLLKENGVKCTEDQSSYDVIFQWPLDEYGLLVENFTEIMNLSRTKLSEGGYIFPSTLDVLGVCIGNSPTLKNRTEVFDENTSGFVIADVINMFKTTHQLDVHLATLPHTQVTDVFRSLSFNFITGSPNKTPKGADSNSAKASHKDESDDKDDSKPLGRYTQNSLIVGGPLHSERVVVKAFECGEIIGIAHWFSMYRIGKKTSDNIVIDTKNISTVHSNRINIEEVPNYLKQTKLLYGTSSSSLNDTIFTVGESSICKQACFLTECSATFEEGENVIVEGVYRDGSFWLDIVR